MNPGDMVPVPVRVTSPLIKSKDTEIVGLGIGDAVVLLCVIPYKATIVNMPEVTMGVFRVTVVVNDKKGTTTRYTGLPKKLFPFREGVIS